MFETYSRTGFNYRLTDIQAAVGLQQLKKLPIILERRREQAACYTRLLKDVPGVISPSEPAYGRANWQSYVVRLAKDEWQRPVMDALRAKGIATARGVMCAHLEPPYRGGWPLGSLPNSEAMRNCGLILPLHHHVSEEDQRRVVSALAAAIADAAA